jgi:hypothetical protein
VREPLFYTHFNCFPKEISAIRLATPEADSQYIQNPWSQDYKIIIDDDNVF